MSSRGPDHRLVRKAAPDERLRTYAILAERLLSRRHDMPVPLETEMRVVRHEILNRLIQVRQQEV